MTQREKIMEKINEVAYIELYNQLDTTGKCKYDSIGLGKIFGIKSERSVQRYESGLRRAKKIKLRKEIEVIEPIIPTKEDTAVIPIDWTIPKSKKASAKKKLFKTYMLIGDLHIPAQNTAAVKVVLNIMDNNNFDGMVNLGDFMGMDAISHWNKTKKLTSEMKRLKDDYIAGNLLLDEFDKRLPKNADKYFLWGNHESWYYQFIEELPMLEGMLNPNTELKLVERGYKVFDGDNPRVKLGRLWITHGMYTVQNFVKKHMETFASNVLHAHMHTIRQRYASSAVREIALAGYCIGCLCDLNPDYTKNKPKAYVHGFGILYLFDDGFFDVQLVRIVKDRAIYNGKLYNGSK